VNSSDSTAAAYFAKIVIDIRSQDRIMTLREQIAQQALALPPEDRAFLADLLEQSLNAEGFSTPELASEWAAEVARRIAAYERGETHAVDAASAVREMREGLAKSRAGR
jgi:putative addiction module component (TIGR02574 family)